MLIERTHRHRGSQSMRHLIGVLVFAISVFVIVRAFSYYQHRWTDVMMDMRVTPTSALLGGILGILSDYTAQSQFDRLGLTYLQKRVPLMYAMLCGFIGQAVSVSSNVLIGNSVRYRLYRRFHLTLAEATTLTAFCMGTFVLGFLFLGGIIFLVEPQQLLTIFHLPEGWVRAIGAACLVIVTLYLVSSAVKIKIVRLRHWTVTIPPLRIAGRQLLFATLSWMGSVIALFALLHEAPIALFPTILGAFLLAQCIGQISQSPGGFGVFEATMLLALSSAVPAEGLLSALIIYRVLYQFCILVIALVLFGTIEVYEWYVRPFLRARAH